MSNRDFKDLRHSNPIVFETTFKFFVRTIVDKNIAIESLIMQAQDYGITTDELNDVVDRETKLAISQFHEQREMLLKGRVK